MAIIESTRIGTIEYKEDEIISFGNGIPGFNDEKRFIIYQPESGNPLAFMQSLQSKDLMFVIADPFTFFPDYQFNINDAIIEELKVEANSDLSIWGILSVPDNFQESTINLRAPLLINYKSKAGKQYIINETNFSAKTPLFPHLVEEGSR